MSSAELVVTPIEEEMKRSYIDYAMSVIVSRALPDVRDGLKPVHRRILYSMHDTNCDWNRPHRKSARIVGDVMGKYHPHGDSAIYDALVRMAQEFSLLAPLIDGQGNFGSLDGDSPAAMRYTESRLARISSSLTQDIEFDTVNFQDNYDGSEQEPQVLPARFPNLLVNGAGGIAVGMATNIPSHNLGEVIDACCLYLDNSNLELADILSVMPGPDFPTGGSILGRGGIYQAFATGRGSVVIRGKVEIETQKDGRQSLIITEIPYQVNKARLVEKIAELAKEKRIEGINDLRDESDKNGIRVVLELKKDAMPEVIENQLYSYTQLQTSFGVNMVALSNGLPKLMNVIDVIRDFISFRREVVSRRTTYLLRKARNRAHLLVGLAVAVNNIDEVIKLIKSARDPETAKQELLSRDWEIANIIPMLRLVADFPEDNPATTIKLTEEQAKAILEMRLQRLTGLEMEKIHNDLAALAEEIGEYLSILASPEKVTNIIRDELLEVKQQYAIPRRTQIEDAEYEQDIEALIPREDMVVTITTGGYIKRVPLNTYRAQNRGGKGRAALSMHEDDVTTEVFVTSTHSVILFFTSFGKVYQLKTYKLPVGTPTAKGRSLRNLLNIEDSETIQSVLTIPEEHDEYQNIVFATKGGNIRRNHISDFTYINSAGKIAMKLESGDALIGVALCRDSDHILLASHAGKAIRFPVDAVRVFKGRSSDGVRALRLEKEDKLISLSVLHGAEFDSEIRDEYLRIPLEARAELAKTPDAAIPLPEGITLPLETIASMAASEEFILTITENGYGKRTSAYEYRITNRGGMGVTNILTTTRNGKVAASFTADDNTQLMLITNQGKIIRLSASQISVIGRSTQGVLLFRTEPEEIIVSAAKIVVNAEENSDNERPLGEEGEAGPDNVTTNEE